MANLHFLDHQPSNLNPLPQVRVTNRLVIQLHYSIHLPIPLQQLRASAAQKKERHVGSERVVVAVMVAVAVAVAVVVVVVVVELCAGRE